MPTHSGNALVAVSPWDSSTSHAWAIKHGECRLSAVSHEYAPLPENALLAHLPRSSKLAMRVRFSSPAPHHRSLSAHTPRAQTIRTPRRQNRPGWSCALHDHQHAIYRSASGGTCGSANRAARAKLITPDPCPIRAQYSPASGAKSASRAHRPGPNGLVHSRRRSSQLAGKHGTSAIRSKFGLRPAQPPGPRLTSRPKFV
jgi:hypothetical protein